MMRERFNFIKFRSYCTINFLNILLVSPVLILNFQDNHFFCLSWGSSDTSSECLVWQIFISAHILVCPSYAYVRSSIKSQDTGINRPCCLKLQNTMPFIMTLFTLARKLKQPMCPWADKWITIMWCIYTMEYSLAIKRLKSYYLQQHRWNQRQSCYVR